MQRIEKMVSGLIQPMNLYASVLLGVMTFVWGVWVVNPFWHVFTRAAIYDKTLEFAPEWAWGTWSTVCGAALVAAVFKRSTRWVSRASAFAMWHWFTISLMFWWGDWQNTAGLTYMFIGLYATYIFLNVRLNWVRLGIRHF